VARPSRWSNPFRMQHKQRRYRCRQLAEVAVLLFEAYYEDNATFRADMRLELGGKDVWCYCSLVDAQGQHVPCHADIVLSWANE
jgi:hypothetical protein